MSHLVDASVVLAMMLGEKGAEAAWNAIEGSMISTVNVSEIYRKLVDQGMPLTEATVEVGRIRFEMVPFDDMQTIEAARLRPLTRHLGLSFADRACLALAGLRRLPIYTADRDWAKLGLGLDIRMIR